MLKKILYPFTALCILAALLAPVAAFADVEIIVWTPGSNGNYITHRSEGESSSAIYYMKVQSQLWYLDIYWEEQLLTWDEDEDKTDPTYVIACGEAEELWYSTGYWTEGDLDYRLTSSTPHQYLDDTSSEYWPEL